MKTSNDHRSYIHNLSSCEIKGAAHNECRCNLKLRLNSKTMPIRVVFHNLKGYDGHHLRQKGNVKSERRNKM